MSVKDDICATQWQWWTQAAVAALAHTRRLSSQAMHGATPAQYKLIDEVVREAVLVQLHAAGGARVNGNTLATFTPPASHHGMAVTHAVLRLRAAGWWTWWCLRPDRGVALLFVPVQH